MKYAIGLDIGGTKMQSIVAEWDKNFLVSRKLPKIVKSRHVPIQHKDDKKKFFQDIVDEIELLQAEFGKRTINRIGVGIAAPLTKNKMLMEMPIPHIPLSRFPIRTKLESIFKLPIFVGNDANCFTWAEHLFGAARLASSTIGITLGTGVGGGVVFDAAGTPVLWEGFHGGAGEIGYMILGDGETSFNQLCSSGATYLWRNSDPLSAAQKAEDGDVEAQEAFRRFGFWLGISISNMINMFNPEMIVVGGSITKSWDLFSVDMFKSMESHIAVPPARNTQVIRGILGDDAGAIGAAYLPL